MATAGVVGVSRWRVQPGRHPELAKRDSGDTYQSAYEEAIARTSTDRAGIVMTRTDPAMWAGSVPSPRKTAGV